MSAGAPGDIPAEQTRRLAECWGDSAPTPAEMRGLRARLAARRAPPQRSRFKVLAIALAQGFVLGGVTLAAAAWVGHALPIFTGRAATEASRAAGPPAARRDKGAGVALGASPAASARRDGPGSVAAFDDVERSETRGATGSPGERTAAPGGTALRGRPSAPPVTAGSAAVVRDESASVEALPADPALGAAAEGPWARVARALSASDWLRADKALVELGSTNDPATRDAADLARAELWIAHGQGVALRASVERLAARGQTPLIRKRAARLLERMP